MTPYFAKIHPPRTYEHPQLDQTYQKTYTVPISDGCGLEIPLCALPGGQEAIALLMSNQSPFQVIEHITTLMAHQASLMQPDCIAAVPTMGLEYASRVAQKLGKADYVALGFSHKFWYDEQFCEPVVSTTSPDQKKNLYIDPALIARVNGKRVVVIDDVINTGTSVLAALRLLKRAGAHIIGAVVALTEGYAWQETLKDPFLDGASEIKAIGHIPVFTKKGHLWIAHPDTL